MSKPAVALPADLLLLLNDLEHVLSFNGLQGHQHTRYIADEIQAKAETRDAQDQGKLDQLTSSRKRTKELLLKNEAYAMCFDAFSQSCTMHQPRYQAAFQQKLWQHVMQLLEEWQALHEQQQVQKKSLALDHLHLKQEHKALKDNLKTLKLTVQTLLSDVSALLHHATHKDASTAAPAAQPATQGTSSISSSISSSTRSSDGWQPQPQQSSSMPSAPARRSADIVSSLIKSIEDITRQFALCQAGRLVAGADADGGSRAVSCDRQQHNAANTNEQAPAQAAAPSSRGSSSQSSGSEHDIATSSAACAVVNQLRHPSPASSSRCSCASADARGPPATTAHSGPKSKTGMPPLVPKAPQGKHSSCQQAGGKCSTKQQGRNMATAKSAIGPITKRDKTLTLAGASPHRSHPPSAFDSSLAWFMQNAGSRSNNSSMTGNNSGRKRVGSPGQASGAAQQLSEAAPGKFQPQTDQSETDFISASQVKAAEDDSINATSPQIARAQNVNTTVFAASVAAVQPAPAEKQVAEAPLPSHILAASSPTPAATPIGIAAHTPALAAASGAQHKQQQPEWMAILMQQPDALQKVRAAVRFALSPAELEPEPSVADWAGRAGSIVAYERSAPVTAEGHSVGAGHSNTAAVHALPPNHADNSITAVATTSASPLGGNSSSSHRRQSLQSAAGELSLMTAAAAVAEQQGHSLYTAPWVGKPVYTLATATEQQMPNASRFTQQQQQQQQQLLYEVQSCSADEASPPGLQMQSHPNVCARRPASSHETRSGSSSSGSSGSGTGGSSTADAAAGRSRSACAGFSPLVPARMVGGQSWAPVVTAGPLTAALQRQTSLHKQLPGPVRPYRQTTAAAAPGATGPPSALADAQRGGATADRSKLGSTAAAGSRHQPAAAVRSCWRPAVGSECGAAAAGAHPPPAAADEPGSEGLWRKDGATGPPQQQQGYSQRLVHKKDVQQQQQQQQHMAAVPECRADPVGLVSEGVGTAANTALSMASSSIGSDIVRLGSCNAGFWAGASTINNGNSSPPEQSTASQANSPLTEAAAGSATERSGIAGLIDSAAGPQPLQDMQHPQQQAPVAPEMEAPGTAQLAYTVAARGVDAAGGRGAADDNATVSREAASQDTANELVNVLLEQQQQQPQAAQGSRNRSIAAAELKADGSSVEAETYSGLIDAAAAAATTAEGEDAPSTETPAPAAAANSVVPIGEHVDDSPYELPDVVKPAYQCDSPRKQPRSAAAAAALPSCAATHTTDRKASAAVNHVTPINPLDSDVAQQQGHDSSIVAAAATAAPSLRASGDKRALQHSRSNLSSSMQAQYNGDWCVRALQTRQGPTSIPVDDSPLSPLCKRVRSSLVLLDTTLCEPVQQEGAENPNRNVSAKVRCEADVAAAGCLASEPLAAAAGQQSTGLAAKPRESPCAASSDDNTVLVLQQQQHDGSMTQQWQQLHQVRNTTGSSHRLSEDGERDVGPARDCDKSETSKRHEPRDTAANTAWQSYGRLITASAGSSHHGPKGSSSMPGLGSTEAQQAAAFDQSRNGASMAAEFTASSADSVIASSADSSDIVSTATGRVVEVATAPATAVMVPRVTAAEHEHEGMHFVLGASSSRAFSSTTKTAMAAAAADDRLDVLRCSADRVSAKTTAAGGESAMGAGSCKVSSQPADADGHITQSFELPGAGAVLHSPDLAGVLDSALRQAVPTEAAAADSAHAEDLCFSLEELVAILIDVMHSKQEQDERLSASGLLCQTPTAFLQRYLAAKVHGDREAYGNALNALLSGLDAHKQDQPEVAVFCRILAGDIEEQYFSRHLDFRSQLQNLAAQACEQLQQHSADKQQQAVVSWAACCSVPLHQKELLWLLDAWSRSRAEVLAQDAHVTMQQLRQTQQEWWFFIRQHCSGSGPSAEKVVSALLFWELQQHVMCLQATVEAFRVADQRHSGLLDLEQFRVFCNELNDTMSDDEVITLWSELDKLRHGTVTFGTICSCLLPAMDEA